MSVECCLLAEIIGMNGLNVGVINVITSTAACLISLFIAVGVWQRRYSQSALWFVALVLSISWVSFWYVIEAAADYNVQAYVTGCKFEYLGLTLIPLFWLGFTLSISGHAPPFGAACLSCC